MVTGINSWKWRVNVSGHILWSYRSHNNHDTVMVEWFVRATSVVVPVSTVNGVGSEGAIHWQGTVLGTAHHYHNM